MGKLQEKLLKKYLGKIKEKYPIFFVRQKVWWKPQVIHVVVVIPFHAWMDVRTASLIRKALELPAQKYFESIHSQKDANSCQKPRPEKKQKNIFSWQSRKWNMRRFPNAKNSRFFLQSCWKLEFMLKAEMLEQVYLILSQISK